VRFDLRLASAGVCGASWRAVSGKQTSHLTTLANVRINGAIERSRAGVLTPDAGAFRHFVDSFRHGQKIKFHLEL
jgi:hypothetical protein